MIAGQNRTAQVARRPPITPASQWLRFPKRSGAACTIVGCARMAARFAMRIIKALPVGRGLTFQGRLPRWRLRTCMHASRPSMGNQHAHRADLPRSQRRQQHQQQRPPQAEMDPEGPVAAAGAGLARPPRHTFPSPGPHSSQCNLPRTSLTEGGTATSRTIMLSRALPMMCRSPRWLFDVCMLVREGGRHVASTG